MVHFTHQTRHTGFFRCKTLLSGRFVQHLFLCNPGGGLLPKVPAPSNLWVSHSKDGIGAGLQSASSPDVSPDSLAYGSKGVKAELFGLGMEFLNRLRKTNHTGSDIRVIIGDVLNSEAYPRQSVASKWWKWRPIFSKCWKHSSHINVLELQAILLGIKYQILRLQACDQRIFQLTDSYVCQSVVSKGRTSISSIQLTRVLNYIAAHLLGFGLRLILAHVESGDNPADDGSQQ